MVKKVNCIENKFLLIATLWLYASLTFAQDVKVNAYTDTTEYLIGDYIKYTIQVTSPKNVSILTTGFRDSLANVEVISVDNPRTEEKDNSKITT